MADTLYNNIEVVILGAGGLAREIVSWITVAENKSLEVVGFMDDNLNALDGYDVKESNLGKIDFSQIKDFQSVLFGIADGGVKKKLFEKSKEYNVKTVGYTHHTALVGERTVVGEGLVLCPFSIISCDSKIGDLVFVNSGSQIGHDVVIGDYTSIMANVDIGGGAQIGNNVFIGSGAIVLPGVKIPDNTIVGAGAVVIRTIKQEGTYFGNPAKKIF
ncbi:MULTISPECIES: acetyltransferase [unclassified Flavobacterium]|uniref:acetyltransferase n=1 Tax=unclassified Flavobacterium TaxID=196869 RepID=UPI003615DDEC